MTIFVISYLYLRRCYVGVTSLDGCIYAVGGFDGTAGDSRLKSAEKFEPCLNVWVKLPDMLDRRSDAGLLKQKFVLFCLIDGQLVAWFLAGAFEVEASAHIMEHCDDSVG